MNVWEEKALNFKQVTLAAISVLFSVPGISRFHDYLIKLNYSIISYYYR